MTAKRSLLAPLIVLTLLVGSCTKKDSPTDPGDPGGESPAPDISVALGTNGGSPADGDTAQVIVQVMNGGGASPGDASGLSVTNRLSAGLTIVASAPGTGSFDPLTGVWTIGALTAGASATLVLDVEAGVGTGGTALPDSAWISALGHVDPNAANDTAVVAIDVQRRRIDIELSKTVDQTDALPADTVTFTVTAVNRGPGPASDIRIVDSLASAFADPAHSLSVGALSGDTLWTIPLLAMGDTAVWTTTAVVSGAAAGTVPRNLVFLDALDQTDTVASNDTASVSVAVSAPDVFVLVEASDSTPPDGETVSVTVSVTNGTAPGAVDVTGLAVTNVIVGSATLLSSSATQGAFDAPSGVWTIGSLAVGVTTTLTLGLETGVGTAGSVVTDSAWVSAIVEGMFDVSNDTSSVSLTVSPRPVDVVVLKTVDDAQPLADSVVTFTVSVVNNGPGPVTNVTVFDSLQAVFVGPVYTVSNGALTGDTLWTIPLMAEGDTVTWMTTATVAANAGGGSAGNEAVLRGLDQADVTPANDTASVTMSFPLSTLPTVTIDAPADSSVFDPGELVTFSGTASDAEDGPISASIVWTSSLDGTLITAASFETDQLSTGVHQIIAMVADSDGGLAADTITVTVALYSIPLTLNVPFSATASLPITLSEPAPTGGVTLSVTSDDPTITTPTVASIFIMEGAQSSNATLQGLTPGTTNVRVSSAQFGTVISVVSVTAELDIQRTSFTLGSQFTETIQITFESQGVPIAAPAGGLAVTLTADDPSCVGSSGSVTIPQGQITTTANVVYGGSAALTCVSYLRASATGVVSDSVQVTVVQPPAITVSPRTVGSGLQVNTTLFLGLSNHGGVDVVVKSANPSTALISSGVSTAGTDSIIVSVPDGTTTVGFYVQGVESATGTPLVTVVAPGFTDGSTTMTVVQPAVRLVNLSGNTTTLSPDDAFYSIIGYPTGNSVSGQRIRVGGSPVTVTFTTSDTGVGVITDGNLSGGSIDLVIPVGALSTPTSVAAGGVAHDPIGVGTATIGVTAPNFIAAPNATGTVTVTAPAITVSPRTVGSGLQVNTTFFLGASEHGGVDVVVKSADPSTALISSGVSTAGTDSIIVSVPDGTTTVGFYVQGVESATGTPLVTVVAPGFTDGSTTMTVVQPAVRLVNLSSSSTVGSADDPFYSIIGYPTGNSVSGQRIRAGGSPVTVTFTTSDTGVGVITDGNLSGGSIDLVIPIGALSTPTSVAAGGVAHDPIGVGTATIGVTAPNFIAAPNATQTVTINP